MSAVASAGAGLLLPAVDCVDPGAGVAAWVAGVASNVSGVAADKLPGDGSELLGADSGAEAAVGEASGAAFSPGAGAAMIWTPRLLPGPLDDSP